jgi:hypothetical protein
MSKHIFPLLAPAIMLLGGFMTACSDFDPKGFDPVPDLVQAQNLSATVAGRTVTLTWDIPEGADVSAVRVGCDNGTPTVLSGPVTSYVLKGQPMQQELLYTVKLVQQGGYVSEGVSVRTTVPYVASKMGYVLLADTPEALPDDDERAAAAWFAGQENAEFVRPEEIAALDPDLYSVLWIMVDRVGLELGWEHLPAALTSTATLEALRAYSAEGGSLYLSNMATQLAVPLGFVPETWNPTCYGNGDGGTGDDVWVINPYLGWDFRDGSDQGFYDRTGHAVYAGLTLEDPNNYGYPNLPLIGPGRREDHNCLWDCNVYGKGAECDVIKNFEVQTSSLVLATWGHVRDHCVAGLVEFYATAEHGQCIANGFAAYEWNQNSGTNPYQANIEGLTANILNYLK